MKKITLVVLLLFIAVLSKAQRNVILIVADDVGTDYFSFYEDHGDTATMPNINTLLKKGIRFQNAMSSPLCSSTRSGILCGRYSFRRMTPNGGGEGHMDSSEVTIPRLLNNYDPNISKVQIGKWHIDIGGCSDTLNYPTIMGYDYYSGALGGNLPNYFNWTKVTNGVPHQITNYATIETANDAISWIQGQPTNKPFFMWLAFNAAHTPYHLPAAGLYSDTTLTGSVQDINQNPKKYFKATLEAMDHEIGRLFDSLQVLNKFDSTDFIFIGDNGNSKGTAQIADSSRAKSTIYQYGVHVPFIISGPSVVNPGRASNALVNTLDIFATVVELFGDTGWHSQTPINEIFDSKSIMPVILNVDTAIRPWSFTEVFSSTPDSTHGKAMRNMDYKLLNFNYGHQEFYKLAVDTSELNDLLKGPLTTTDITNYNYLCNQMTNLVGTGSFCNASVGINETLPESNLPQPYPNPFTSAIHVKSKTPATFFELYNENGQLIYSGKKIELQNFSSLANGVYFLKIIDKKNSLFKLLKD